jgi:hypothetical protein
MARTPRTAKAEILQGRRALAASYDPGTDRVMVELTSGYVFGFPAKLIPQLANATPDTLALVEVSPGGIGLHWEALDVDLSVPGLLLSSLGRSERARELARLAGRTTSRAKAAAARANGAKGGRPRKLVRR